MSAAPPKFIDQLPGELYAIAEHIGLPATLRLIEARGGRRIYFPAGAGPDHHLVKLLGQEAADTLCREYTGERLEIPKAEGYLRALRNALIQHSRAKGISQATLAGEHGLTERQIRNIQRDDCDDGQIGLF